MQLSEGRKMAVEVRMLPVSEGDATLLLDRSDGETKTTILIDAGRRKDEVAKRLHELKTKSIDLMIISHVDLDHVGGMAKVIDEFDVKRIWCFDIYRIKDALNNLGSPGAASDEPGRKESIEPFFARLVTVHAGLKAAYAKGTECFEVQEGAQEVIGRLGVEILWPPEAFVNHVLTPDCLRRYFTEKCPPSEWITSESDARERIDRRKAQSLVKKIIEEREMTTREESGRSGPLDACDGGEAWPGEHFANNLSVVARVTVIGDPRAPSVLFPGDLEDWTSLIGRYGHSLRSGIWKVPHHGSKDVGFDFERLLTPELVEQTLRRLPRPWRCFFEECVASCDHGVLAFPWMLPYSPFIWPLNGPSLRGLRTRGGLREIVEIVRPAKSLIFPFPSRKLPNLSGIETSLTWGEVVCNREKSRTLSLNDPTLTPEEAIVEL
jgi:beta-lactamase superfamily II metal-dependent hydrolase